MTNFSQIVEIIKKEKNIEVDKEVGELLGLSNISQTISRNSIPFEELLTLCETEGWSLNWLLTGQGEKKKRGFSLDQIPRPFCTFVKSLRSVPKNIRIQDFLTIPLVEGRVAAGDPLISEDKIEGWAIIHVSQIGHRGDLVAVRIDERDGKSMEPCLRPGSMVAIDRGDRDIIKDKIYAVRNEWGCTIKYVQKREDLLILRPANPDYEIQILDLRDLTYDPIIGRVIWVWQTF